MSGMKLTMGYAVALKVPVDHEEMSDYLDNTKSLLQVSYDGTVVYMDSATKQDETCGWWVMPTMLGFLTELQNHHDRLNVDMASLRPVVQHYYNGADDYFSDLTADTLKSKEPGA